MNFFGRQKTRSPTEAVKGLKECIIRMDQSSGESRRKASRMKLTCQSVGYG